MTSERQPVSLAAAFDSWATLNAALADAMGGQTPETLGLSLGRGRWPLWAVVGHATCQRVFWLCDVAGEPGAESTPFTNAAWNCPGDDDLDNVLDAGALVRALDSTFAVVSDVLARWTFADLGEVLSRPDWGDERRHTRAEIIQRVFAHDVWHAAEANEILTRHGHRGFDVWS